MEKMGNNKGEIGCKNDYVFRKSASGSKLSPFWCAREWRMVYIQLLFFANGAKNSNSGFELS